MRNTDDIIVIDDPGVGEDEDREKTIAWWKAVLERRLVRAEGVEPPRG